MHTTTLRLLALGPTTAALAPGVPHALIETLSCHKLQPTIVGTETGEHLRGTPGVVAPSSQARTVWV